MPVLTSPAEITTHGRGLIPRFVTALSFLFFVISILSGSAVAQISPGPLSKAHENLSGTTKCTSCHEFGTSVPTFKCLTCHKEVAQALSEGHGYHAKLGMKNPNGKECVHCHLEHNGSDFQLVHWLPSQAQFDHRQTGYPLLGKHAPVACDKCHTPAHISPTDRALIQRKDASKSFFGLSANCVSCHVDYHKGQLGTDCQRCHNVNDWKDAKQFDHSKTRYPLTGMHIQVTCEKCHKSDVPDGPSRFKDMQFATCAACHTDPHHGAFKQTCEQCHTTAGWKKVLPGFAFDHSKTKFPLLGKHAQVNCAACHSGGDFKKPVAFQNCSDCHKPDPHKGQFAERPLKGECAECHTVEGWKPSLFGVTQHASSKYPLEGKHAVVECGKCHTPMGKDTVYKLKFASCSDCHQDAHGGQFAGVPYRNRCESCHTVADFHRSLYTIAKHQETKFPLTGAHAAVPCTDCHKLGAGGRADKLLPFHFEDGACTTCHVDPHHGEFKERMDRRRIDGSKFGCQACHNTQSWAAVEGFDHSKTTFPLLGAHRTVSCGACHKVQVVDAGNRFKGTPHACEACHTDPHAAQFISREGKTPCGDCHVVERWVPSTFDHDKRTQFPLRGGHERASCDKCHSLTKTVNGKPVLFYKPTPTKCEACHVVGRNEPVIPALRQGQ